MADRRIIKRNGDLNMKTQTIERDTTSLRDKAINRLLINPSDRELKLENEIYFYRLALFMGFLLFIYKSL